MKADVELVIAEVVEMHPWAEAAFPDQPKRMGRIEGWVNGKRYAAMVPPDLVDDRPAAEAYLRFIAERTEA